MTSVPSLGPRGEGWLAAQIGLIAAVGVAPSQDPFRGPDDWVSQGVGAALIAAGLIVVVIATLQLTRARALSPLPAPKPGAELVQSGVYARVRHPIYFGMTIVGLGWAVAWLSPLAFLAALGLLGVLFMKASREEAWLASRHPEYAAYRARTKRIIPGLL